MIDFLWKNRERPTPFSRRWLMCWAKRIYLLPRLLTICLMRFMLQRKGLKIGQLSIIYALEINGNVGNIEIGSSTSIANGVHITSHAKVSIGSNVVINSGVRIISASHDLADPQWGMFSRPINIADYAWIATGAILLPGASIGYGAVVGAGAVVASEVPDFSLAVGNPAKITSNRRTKDLKYDPVAFTAPYEAWLGRQHALPSSMKK